MYKILKYCFAKERKVNAFENPCNSRKINHKLQTLLLLLRIIIIIIIIGPIITTIIIITDNLMI